MGEMDGLLAAEDGAVRSALGQELKRLKGVAEPAAALGVGADASAGDVRARFLALVKAYHPNRFARRPPDIKKLANEVFLHLRRAHQRMTDRQPAQLAPPSAPSAAGAAAGAAAIGTSPAGAQAAAAVAARASEVSPPSQPKLDVDAALAARRRRVRSNPSSPTTGPMAGPVQVLERVRRRDIEHKERFQTALADLGRGQLESARNALRTLAAESPSDRRFRAYLHYVTGRMHEAAGRASDALAEYDRALSFDPDLEPARGSRQVLGGGDKPDGGGGAGRRGRWFRK
ncbi:MAG TPA: J domain-containing protein [Kofleriaceae bacterium]|nr:J domain-containing protein [Kofleriaceae bacterium]